MSKNGENWGKFIAAKGFKKLPKVQNIDQSGHTGSDESTELWRSSWPVLYLNA